MATGSEGLGSNKHRFTYDWAIPDAPGIFDIFALLGHAAPADAQSFRRARSQEASWLPGPIR